MTVLFLVLATASARPWIDRADTDDDGVYDRDDLCYRIPETANGFEDHDGCPDTLGSVTVGGTFGKRIVEDATVLIETEDDRESGTGTVTMRDLMPGSRIKVAAVHGCHAAEAEVEVEDRPRKIRLQMKPALFSEVTLVVRDANGQSPDRAVLLPMESEPIGCSISEPTELPGGFGVLRLGHGEHTVGIQRAGKPYAHKFTVHGGEQTVLIDLPSGTSRDGGELLAEMIYFDSGASSLSDASREVVARVAANLRSQPQFTTVVVEGHADSRAWGPYNDQLSMRRAEAVVAELVAQGVSADRLVPAARGEKEPVDTSGTREGLAKNRRVQFIVRRGAHPSG